MPTLHLFDLDNTLEHTEVHLRPVFQEQLFLAVVAEGYQGSFAEYRQQCHVFFQTHGHSVMGWAESLGMPPEWVMTTIEDISQHLHQPVVDAVEPCPELLRMLQHLKDAGHTVAVATHGHAIYAKPVLTHLGILGDIVPPELPFDLGRTNGQLKRQMQTFRWIEAEIAAHTGRTTFDRKVLYEDSLLNLRAGRQVGYVGVFIKPAEDVLAREIQISMDTCDFWFPTIQQALLEVHQF